MAKSSPVGARIVGSGPHRVLALHGWFGSATGWGYLPDLVDPDRFSYAFLDYRGYGERRDVAGQYTMEEITQDVLECADELGWERFSLLGHSMGGMAMARVLLEAPDRVDRLVGISPVPASGVPFDDAGWALFAGAADDPAHRHAIIALTTGNRLTPVWVDQVVRHSIERSTPAAIAAYLEAWAHTDFAARAQGDPTPIKVIVGEHDPALSAAVMEQTWLRRYPAAELEVLPNAGHYAMFEAPVALVTSVERFLAD
jgi:pimeloyl-ACP methyl ester carboxylesterase